MRDSSEPNSASEDELKEQDNLEDSQLVFVKLGGSLITDKRQPEAPRLDVLQKLALEIAEARQANPNLKLVIGHGSGSFGHIYGEQYGTRQGVATAEQWYGFARTADAAVRLNRLVTSALLDVEIPVWSIQPSVALRCVDGQIEDGPTVQVLSDTIQQALQRGLVPIIHGDVAFDHLRGGTIASTEEIFDWLTRYLLPTRIVLAGEVGGIYTTDPNQDPEATLIPEITQKTVASLQMDIGQSHGVDVTGGMETKVAQSIDIIRKNTNMDVIICSGLVERNLFSTLCMPNQHVGTRIRWSL